MFEDAELDHERHPKRQMALAQGSGPGFSDSSVQAVGTMFEEAELEHERRPKRQMALEQGPGQGVSKKSVDGISQMFDQAEKELPRAYQAQRILKHVIAGGDEKGLKISRKEMLDVLEMGLSDSDFSLAAASLILSLPGTVVDSKETKAEAMKILVIELHNKQIARRLLDQETKCIVVPKDQRMTDLVEFQSLKGSKTPDGRSWEDVRGSGGFKIPGKPGIWVAICEENITGTDATGTAAATQWCYNKGYSTTSHELAHTIDIFGLDPQTRKEIDVLYAAKQQAEAKAPQEWIDGYNSKKGKVSAADAAAAWVTAAKGSPDESYVSSFAPYLFDASGPKWTDRTMDNWRQWAVTKGMVSADEKTMQLPNGTAVGTIGPDGTTFIHGGPPFTTQTCYAASDRLEYFAQGANAFFGTNTGREPYVGTYWNSVGDAAKGMRRNGKAELKRIEPELYKIMEKVFGAKSEMTGANPRK
jgi:hypothetical protein